MRTYSAWLKGDGVPKRAVPAKPVAALILAHDRRVLDLFRNFGQQFDGELYTTDDLLRGLAILCDKKPAIVFLQDMLANHPVEEIAGFIKELHRNRAPKIVCLRETVGELSSCQACIDESLVLALPEPELSGELNRLFRTVQAAGRESPEAAAERNDTRGEALAVPFAGADGRNRLLACKTPIVPHLRLLILACELVWHNLRDVRTDPYRENLDRPIWRTGAGFRWQRFFSSALLTRPDSCGVDNGCLCERYVLFESFDLRIYYKDEEIKVVEFVVIGQKGIAKSTINNFFKKLSSENYAINSLYVVDNYNIECGSLGKTVKTAIYKSITTNEIRAVAVDF